MHSAMCVYCMDGIRSSGYVAYEDPGLLVLSIETELQLHAVFHWVVVRLSMAVLNAASF